MKKKKTNRNVDTVNGQTDRQTDQQTERQK